MLFTATCLAQAPVDPSQEQSPVADGSRINASRSIAVGVLPFGAYKDTITRLERIGCEAVLLEMDAGLERLRTVDVVFLPTHCGDPGPHRGKAADYHKFIREGGGLIVSQPNIDGTLNLLPYPITFINSYIKDEARTAEQPDHPIIAGMAAEALPFPADRVKDVDERYRVLVTGVRSKSPSLLVAEFGSGRIVVQTASEASFASTPFPDRLLVGMIEWVIDLRIDPTDASREHAAALLEEPEAMEAAIPGLIQQLADEEAEKRREAMEVLLLLGDAILSHAQRTLAKGPLEEADRAAAVSLIEQLGDDDYTLRVAAVEKLIELGPPVAALIRDKADLSDPEVAMRVEQVEAALNAQPRSQLPIVRQQLALIAILAQLQGSKATALLEQAAERTDHPALAERAASILARPKQ